MSLYSMVAQEGNQEPKRHTESVERLSILQKRSKYQERDSILSSYKVSPQLSKKLGLESAQDRKASLRHVNIDIESLKRYSKNSIMLQSLTNMKPDDLNPPKIPQRSSEEQMFESSKLTLVLKKIQAKN